jgi:DnaK suppressor protein
MNQPPYLNNFSSKKGIIMKPMTKKLEAIRKELLERKHELDRLLSERAHATTDQEAGKDIGDQAMTSTMETLNKSLQDSEYAEYSGIVQALNKIEEGSYGLCIDCNEAIPERRLTYYPNATRCLACQEAYEDAASNTLSE